MNHTIYFLVLASSLITIILLQLRYSIISDSSTAAPKPYSLARVQLVWWTFIILSSFISIVLASGQIPTFDNSTLILLGIGSLTTASARIIDISDKQNPPSVSVTSVNQTSQGFLLDILSDNNGVSIHRLQAFVFNLVFGVWFIYKCYKGIPHATTAASSDTINSLIPVITNNNLILLGLSAGTYVALKSAENK